MYITPVNVSGNILGGGTVIAGNVWLTPTGSGFSQVCTDDDSDEICDSNYVIGSSNDMYPLIYTYYEPQEEEPPEEDEGSEGGSSGGGGGNSSSSTRTFLGLPSSGVISQLLTVVIMIAYFIFS